MRYCILKDFSIYAIFVIYQKIIHWYLYFSFLMILMLSHGCGGAGGGASKIFVSHAESDPEHWVVELHFAVFDGIQRDPKFRLSDIYLNVKMPDGSYSSSAMNFKRRYRDETTQVDWGVFVSHPQDFSSANSNGLFTFYATYKFDGVKKTSAVFEEKFDSRETWTKRLRSDSLKKLR